MPAVGRAKTVYGFIPRSGSSAIAAMQGTMYSTADQTLLWRSPIPMINPHDGIDIEGDGTEALFRAVDAAVSSFDTRNQRAYGFDCCASR
jgi:hypothetical protein